MNDWHVRNTPYSVPICQSFRNLISEIRVPEVPILIVLLVTHWGEALLDIKLSKRQ